MAKATPMVEADVQEDEFDGPLLELSTTAPKRPTVKIDGRIYELRVMDDFGIAKQQELTRMGNEFDSLWNAQARLNNKQRDRLQFLLDEMFGQVLDAPSDVCHGLTDSQRQQVVLAFTLAPLIRQRIRVAREETEAETKTKSKARRSHQTTAS